MPIEVIVADICSRTPQRYGAGQRRTFAHQIHHQFEVQTKRIISPPCFPDLLAGHHDHHASTGPAPAACCAAVQGQGGGEPTTPAARRPRAVVAIPRAASAARRRLAPRRRHQARSRPCSRREDRGRLRPAGRAGQQCRRALVKRTPVADYTGREFVDAVLDVNVRHVVRFMREGAGCRCGGRAALRVDHQSQLDRCAPWRRLPGSVIWRRRQGLRRPCRHPRPGLKELAKDGIRVNAISPAVITTLFHERFLTAEQLAAMQAIDPDELAGHRPRNAPPPSSLPPRLRGRWRLRHRPDDRDQRRPVHALRHREAAQPRRHRLDTST